MIEDSVKSELDEIKNRYKLKNDSDTIVFLISLLKEAKEIPKTTVEVLIGLQNK
ncbi:hypothetical protein D3C85_1900200 [compost metagenome]